MALTGRVLSPYEAHIIGLVPPVPAPAPRREVELDFLRGIAILAVVDFHAPVRVLTYPFALVGFPSAGTLGVNIFFVLSGFLVGGLLIKEWRTRGRVDSKRFLIRRGFKIWPQFYLFLLLNLVTGHRSFGAVWPALLNVQNYVSGSSANSAHLWSLAVEEHAYLLLTLLLAIAWRLKMSMRGIFIVLAALCLIVVSLRVFLSVRNLPLFAPTHSRIAAIFYGVMLAILFHCRPDTFRRMQQPRWLWITAIVGALAFLRFHGSHPWTEAIKIDMSDLIGVSSFMLVYRHHSQKHRIWPYRLIAWIGLYSYGIYLWSVAVLRFAAGLAHRLPHPFDKLFLAIGVPIAGVGIGIVMTKLVELPMLRVRDSLFPRRVRSAVEDSPSEMAQLRAPELLAP